jgi:hypothetical protein
MVVAFQKKLNRLRYASPIRVSCMWVMDIWFFLILVYLEFLICFNFLKLDSSIVHLFVKWF